MEVGQTAELQLPCFSGGHAEDLRFISVIYAYIYIHVITCVFVDVFSDVFSKVCSSCLNDYLFIYLSIYLSMYIFIICIDMCIHIHICIYTFIYLHTCIYIHMQAASPFLWQTASVPQVPLQPRALKRAQGKSIASLWLSAILWAAIRPFSWAQKAL